MGIKAIDEAITLDTKGKKATDIRWDKNRKQVAQVQI